jgi:hypothetical protein
MIKAQGGIFGWVGTSSDVIAAIRRPVLTAKTATGAS